MRAWALLITVAAGCHSAPATPAAPSLALSVSFAPLSENAGPVTVTTAILHLAQLAAVSDRALDTRTEIDAVQLAIGDELTEPLPQAPPGLYSTVNLRLDSADHVGVDISGLYQGNPLHAMLAGGPFDVPCAAPVRLDPGMHAELALSVDMSGWFDGIDLAAALTDMDDRGIVLTEDDNAPLGAVLVQNVMQSFRLSCR
jgi:hypothetical protein